MKLKVTNSDKANLVEKEPDDIINEKDDDEKSNSNNLKTHAVQDDELMQKGNEYTGPSIASSSMTRSSVDSAGFNKLKNGILEKREINSIKLMKYLCFIFGVSTIGFMLLQLFRTQSNFSSLTEYLSQNLYFNHSKIAVSCVYLSTLNLKWKKDKFIDDSFCSINGGNCTDLFPYILQKQFSLSFNFVLFIDTASFAPIILLSSFLAFFNFSFLFSFIFPFPSSLISPLTPIFYIR